MGVFEKAVSFAADRHAGTMRKATEIPYLIHLLEAVTIAAEMTSDTEILAATALHDIVEDTPTTITEVEVMFGSRVAALVAANSEDKMRDLPAADSWKMRKEATINDLKSASFDEKIVILGDKLSNIRSIHRDVILIGEAIWERFNVKDKKMHEWYYRAVAENMIDLSGFAPYREFCGLIEEVFTDTGEKHR